MHNSVAVVLLVPAHRSILNNISFPSDYSLQQIITITMSPISDHAIRAIFYLELVARRTINSSFCSVLP